MLGLTLVMTPRTPSQPSHADADLNSHVSQAACLYTVLFFAPEVLHRDTALMRVLVDKHFVDSWVAAWAPGFTSDIAEEWANYKVHLNVVTVAQPERSSGCGRSGNCWGDRKLHGRQWSAVERGPPQ